MGDKVNIGNSEISLTKAVMVLVFALSVGWGIVNTIIIPINNIQVSLIQIQTALTDNKTALSIITAKDIEQDTRLNLMESAMASIKTKLNLK